MNLLYYCNSYSVSDCEFAREIFKDKRSISTSIVGKFLENNLSCRWKSSMKTIRFGKLWHFQIWRRKFVGKKVIGGKSRRRAYHELSLQKLLGKVELIKSTSNFRSLMNEKDRERGCRHSNSWNDFDEQFDIIYYSLFEMTRRLYFTLTLLINNRWIYFNNILYVYILVWWNERMGNLCFDDTKEDIRGKVIQK